MAPLTGVLGCHQPTLLLLQLPSHDLLDAGVQDNGKKGGKEKRKEKQKASAFSHLSWSSSQNQRAFPGALFVVSNTHFKVSGCIEFSPGDTGWGRGVGK